MSWSTSQVVVDGDTSKLEEALTATQVNESAKAQQVFAIDLIQEAFASGVVDGAYNVSVSGHSDPEQENDRKSFSLSFNPTTVSEVVTATSGSETTTTQSEAGSVSSPGTPSPNGEPTEFQDGDAMPPAPNTEPTAL